MTRIVVWLAVLILYLSQMPASAAAPQCVNFVSGTVFSDINGNGIQEPSEPYTSALIRLEQNGQLYAEKLAEAEFGFVFENVPCGGYDVFVAGRFTQSIQVNDSGPSQSLSLPLASILYFFPIVFID